MDGQVTYLIREKEAFGLFLWKVSEEIECPLYVYASRVLEIDCKKSVRYAWRRSFGGKVFVLSNANFRDNWEIGLYLPEDINTYRVMCESTQGNKSEQIVISPTLLSSDIVENLMASGFDENPFETIHCGKYCTASDLCWLYCKGMYSREKTAVISFLSDKLRTVMGRMEDIEIVSILGL